MNHPSIFWIFTKPPDKTNIKPSIFLGVFTISNHPSIFCFFGLSYLSIFVHHKPTMAMGLFMNFPDFPTPKILMSPAESLQSQSCGSTKRLRSRTATSRAAVNWRNWPCTWWLTNYQLGDDMGFIWRLYGVNMGFIWRLYGNYTGIIWRWNGNSMGFIW